MLFSVIVPIYNVEEYLHECIDSILSQTFRDFELILVDDGSPDGCAAVCDAYAEKDKRVVVIHKPNGGLVSARQAGMERASGEYIINVDGDDFISSDMLGEAFGIIQECHPDIVGFSLNRCSPDGTEVQHDFAQEGFYTKEQMKKTLYPYVLLSCDMRHLFYFLCGKVIRTAVLKPCQMAVSKDISLGEDVACTIPVYAAANSVYMSRLPMYSYRYREQSDSRAFKIIQYHQLICVLAGLRKIGTNEISDLSFQTDRYALFTCFVLLVSAVDAGAYRHIKEIKAYIENPELKKHIEKAVFTNITLKTRIAYALLKKKHVCCAYLFLKLCRLIKKGKKQ